QFDHVDERVAAGEGEVFRFVRTVVTDGHAHRRDEILRRGQRGIGEITGMTESRSANVLARGFTFLDLETNDSRGGHFNCSNADFTIALREVSVAGREQTTVAVNRQIQL